jgi:hypothetical protein
MKESIKQAVRNRAKSCCEYCLAQEQYSADVFSIEHIIPLSKGGTNDLSNLAFSCQCCNNHKYIAIEALDLVTGLMTPLYHPRINEWSEHFTWSEGFSELIGISPTGRATITRLKMNRSGLINLRKVLVEVRQHPPF